MKTLSETWFAEGYIDFELKKYTLLAYLQEINSGFRENKLYPQLADIIFHFNNMISFRDNKKLMQDHFPRRFTGIQLEKLTLLYEQVIEDDELMKELEDIIHYATGKMQKTISDGAEIYEFVEEKIIIMPIGIVPLDNTEGYFFLNNGNEKNTLVYRYRLTIFEKHDEKYRGIKTDFIDSWCRSITSTYENIKMELIRKKTDLPNPAVYAIETSLSFPIAETLLPVAKRYLVKFISVAA
ncbi:MAG: hypothetical protein H7Z13_03300 [Ferruginibacter sp.]|nr:hypothetical protein [Ferruginibacter sp.]